MVFSSISFLYYFLPIVLILYFITPFKYKNLVLFIISLVFYFYGEPKYVLLMILTIFSSYINGRMIDKFKDTKFKKVFLIADIVISLGLLGIFKYTDFFISNINTIFGSNISFLKLALPIGISFYTFQTLSYSIDVYKGNVKAQKSFITLGTYVVLFPQLVAGPIVRYSDIEKELQKRKSDFKSISVGFNRFILGLAKKVILANNFGLLCQIFYNSGDKSVLFYWVYGISYMLQLYFDFSGYSDMAIGLGKIFGFNFPENFNYPYIAKSITDFWRRWHMTLSSFFRDYVYIPLGGNRTSKVKFLRNILIVWFLTGFWHGADWNFIIWGLYFGILLIIEKFFLAKLLDKSPNILCHLYTLLTVLISFIIFNATSLTNVITDIKSLFGFNHLPLINKETIYYLKSYLIVMIIGIIAATPMLKNSITNLKENKKINNIINILEPIYLFILLAIATSYLIDSSFNPFIYFRF